MCPSGWVKVEITSMLGVMTEVTAWQPVLMEGHSGCRHISLVIVPRGMGIRFLGES